MVVGKMSFEGEKLQVPAAQPGSVMKLSGMSLDSGRDEL